MSDDRRLRRMNAVPFNQVSIADVFWAPRMETNRTATLQIEYEHMKQTGRIDVFDLTWKEGDEPRPHQFWDSDVAKWIEAASYSLTTHPDPDLRALVDQVVAKVVSAQQEDGYLNTYYTLVEPDKRWSNLRDMHELYCAGHMMEAAVAHFRATGDAALLDCMCRYADYIDSVFGDEDGKRPGTPGHEEIELALVKLYHVTGNERYLKLSEFFLNQRGQTPSVFQLERPDEVYEPAPGYHQDHLPVREQATAEGHSVRAMYLYSGMADIAAETGDEGLLNACLKLWENVAHRRMYITGGIGSAYEGERFTGDYDLPNERAYAETCAAIGLVFWAHRMVQLTGRSEYADVMERALYNGSISGVSLDGRKFFYVNPLESFGGHHRQDWFGCSCCPPNIARLIASLGEYVYSRSDTEAWVHLFVQGEAELEVAGQTVTLRQETEYPWDGKVLVRVEPETPGTFALNVRVPGWCTGANLRINGKPVVIAEYMHNGYARVEQEWTGEETIELYMPMPVLRWNAHPEVRSAAGCVALQRGPLVYCLEQIDNAAALHKVILPCDAELEVHFREDILGGIMTVQANGLQAHAADWDATLYRPQSTKHTPTKLLAVPYCVWDNRDPGQMRVWLREC